MEIFNKGGIDQRTMLTVKKRDGRIVPFDKEKIIQAILSAMKENNDIDYNLANKIAIEIEKNKKGLLEIEDIQDTVEKKLMASSKKDVAKAYILYRDERDRLRGNTTDKIIQEIVCNENDYWSTENSNKDPQVVTT